MNFMVTLRIVMQTDNKLGFEVEEDGRKITPAKKCNFMACRALDRSYLPSVLLHLKFII